MSGRKSKRRGYYWERWFAERLGTERYPANSGGKIDLKRSATYPAFVVQVKGREEIADYILRGLDTARDAASQGDLPLLLLGTKQHGRRRGLAIMDLEDFLGIFDRLCADCARHVHGDRACDHSS